MRSNDEKHTNTNVLVSGGSIGMFTVRGSVTQQIFTENKNSSQNIGFSGGRIEAVEIKGCLDQEIGDSKTISPTHRSAPR